MSKTPQTPSQSGLLGVAILFCAVAAGAGVAFDFALRGRDGFWLGAQPGGAAALGACAALFAVLAARGARWLLARRVQAQPIAPEQKGGAQDAGAHP